MSGKEEELDWLFSEALEAIRRVGDSFMLSKREKVRQICLVLHRLKRDREAFLARTEEAR